MVINILYNVVQMARNSVVVMIYILVIVTVLGTVIWVLVNIRHILILVVFQENLKQMIMKYFRLSKNNHIVVLSVQYFSYLNFLLEILHSAHTFTHMREFC